MKIEGIKSVEFTINADGFGVVNWNGSLQLMGLDNIPLANHSMPKLRGYTNYKGEPNEETGKRLLKKVNDIDFKENPLYISQNCIRHYLFKEQSYDLHFAKDQNLKSVLVSLTGLIRGYVIPNNQCKKASPLLITDFIDQLGNGNYEQFTSSHSIETEVGTDGEIKHKRGPSSFFSKTTFGETQYVSNGSISIEELQFISLDRIFDRCAMPVKQNEGQALADEISAFLKSFEPDRNPTALFHTNFVRKGTIFKQGQTGILLDDTSIDILVNITLKLIQELQIKQAKGYMYVTDMLVDYNESNMMMRVKRKPDSIQQTKHAKYAVYFEALDIPN